MTRRIYTYISVLLSAALALTSCDKEPALSPSEGDTLTLCLSPSQMTATRETEYGTESLNENTINGFKLYFYSENSETATAKYIYPASGLASAANTGAVVGGTNGLTVDPTTGKVTLKLALDKTLAESLFSSDASHCYVYAVANTGTIVTLPSTVGDASTAMGQIKKLSVLADFGPTETEDPFAKAQSDFVMDGFATLDRDSDNNITGTVAMSRAAAKITFTVTEVKDVEDKDGTWTAQTDQMRVSYRNIVNIGLINGETDSKTREGNYDNFNSIEGRSLTAFTTSDNKTNWTHSLPFYSYFNSWNSSSDANAPYLMLQLPWKYTNATDGSERYFTCYYAVPFNSLERRIDRNCWYKVSLSVSILGSGDPENPTTIYPSYMVLPWGDSPVLTNADLKRYRYLLVDQNSYVMNNIDELAIPFYSSHEVVLVSSSMTKTELRPDSGYKPDQKTVDASEYSLDFDNESIPGKSSVTFKHTLENDYTEDYDVTAYTLTFTFKHKDNDEFTETVTITQYPALYVVASLNSDCKDPVTVTKEEGYWGHITTYSGTNLSGNYDHYGYLYVNGKQSTSSSVSWDGVSDQSNAGNTDPYMYVVTVSSLPEGTSYIIGDPRTEDYTDLPDYNSTTEEWDRSTWSWVTKTTYWASEATAFYGGETRRLTYYYPTDETSRVENMIAPSFRIASSYGVVGPLDYNGAVKRCATYQEDGYPAGRWRVPTAAEIAYMVKLAYDKKIPELLSSSSFYWGSNKSAYQPNDKGGVTSETSFNNNDKPHVRCVYDEWYWTDKLSDSQKDTFYWGDKAR